MSTQAMAWALDHRQTGPLSAEARLVLVALADYTNPTGRGAYPAAGTLAHRLGIAARSVRRSIALLQDLGLIRHGEQALVQHIRADRRPVVWDLALDGVQVLIKVSGEAVELGAEPYDEHFHGVAPTPRRDDAPVTPSPVDNPPRGDVGGRHGVTPASPNPSTYPQTPTHLRSEGDPSAREAIGRPERPNRRGPIGLTDPNCPGCGQRIHRTHHCRASALNPLSTNNAATVRELMLAGPSPTAGEQAAMELGVAPLGDCAGCGRVAHLVDGGDLCPRCLVAIGRMGPHRLEDLA